MRYGLIGNPLGHSFSKEIHERIADYHYDLIPLNESEFHDFMKKRDFQAINVTIPYKKAVIPYLDEMDASAQAIGAVNTIVNHEGKLIGYNTDFTGFSYMVHRHQVQMRNKKVLIIGNGGASCAVQAVVKQEHASNIIVVDLIGENGAVTYDHVYEMHLDAQIIINTSPIGMYPNLNETPIDLRLFHCCEAVIDVVYNPIMTKLCYDAKQLGIKHVNGLEMLVAQAKYAVEHFLDRSIDDRMIDEIYRELVLKRCNIVLIGMPSAGKSTIGKLLAKALDKTFIDMDSYIAEQAKCSIPEIFEAKQEAGFRAFETQAALALSKSNQSVIACGGGVVLHDINMEYLCLNGIVIDIERPLELLISNDSNRPLSSSKEALARMYEKRAPLYHQYADIVIENAHDLETVINAICTQLKSFVK